MYNIVFLILIFKLFSIQTKPLKCVFLLSIKRLIYLSKTNTLKTNSFNWKTVDTNSQDDAKAVYENAEDSNKQS